MVGGCAGPESRTSEPLSLGVTPAKQRLGELHFERGELLLNAHNYQDAVQAFSLALQANPFDYKAHFQLGVCYYSLGDYVLEITEYRKCLALNPNYRQALLYLGHACVSRDELELAQEAYNRYLEFDPYDAAVLYNLSLVELDLGNDEVYQELTWRARAAEQRGN
jgi:tetratricopeptide (TPR) repeat protein